MGTTLLDWNIFKLFKGRFYWLPSFFRRLGLTGELDILYNVSYIWKQLPWSDRKSYGTRNEVLPSTKQLRYIQTY